MNKKKRAILSVTNDLSSDQRVHKISTSLMGMGYDVHVVGRYRPWSEPLDRNYQTYRFKLLFSKKVWFYAEYNLRLFLYLVFYKFDLYIANDLDTLFPNFIVSKIKNKPLVYDSHEYFTEVPELISRPKIRRVWLKIEAYIFPKLKHVYTVNDAIAEIYRKKYKVDVKVIRNIAPKIQNQNVDVELSRRIKGDNIMLIMQGAGINVDRGAEEIIEAMQWIDGAILYLIGSGDVFPDLRLLVKKFKLQSKVFILDKMPYLDLMEYTKISDFGLSLDKGTNPNYENALSNKVFDYIQAQIPLIVSERKVVSALVKTNQIGVVLTKITPVELAKEINETIRNNELLSFWKENLKKASQKYTWEAEEVKLKEIYKLP